MWRVIVYSVRSMQQIKEAIAEATQAAERPVSARNRDAWIAWVHRRKRTRRDHGSRVPTYQQRLLFQEQQLAESLESFVKALNEQDEDCDDHARAFRVPRAFGRREVVRSPVTFLGNNWSVQHLRARPVTNVAGTHLVQYPNCTCTPGPNEACWGYRGTVHLGGEVSAQTLRPMQEVCPRCQERLTGKQIRTTDGCRRNGDGYGFAAPPLRRGSTTTATAAGAAFDREKRSIGPAKAVALYKSTAKPEAVTSGDTVLEGMLNDLLAALRKEQPQDPLSKEKVDQATAAAEAEVKKTETVPSPTSTTGPLVAAEPDQPKAGYGGPSAGLLAAVQRASEMIKGESS
ncbi:Ubiquitin-like domain-containing protein [Durusdinium trenchii]|uniref:Ubiquitin-like domain-containing protein n=1 Tax=Durusdinium trenchii TaxID=1381693 RepID=A0ABP0IZX8_9DINO